MKKVTVIQTLIMNYEQLLYMSKNNGRLKPTKLLELEYVEASDDETSTRQTERKCPVCGQQFYTCIRDAPPTEHVIGLSSDAKYERHEHNSCVYFHKND